MSTSTCCTLNKDRTFLKLHDKCPKNRSACQKQITFTTRHYMLEGGSNKSTLKKFFKGTEQTRNIFLKQWLNTASQNSGLAVAAKTKNPKMAQATSNNLKSISGEKIRSSTDMHGNGLLSEQI